jgi:hypothetical protein
MGRLATGKPHKAIEMDPVFDYSTPGEEETAPGVKHREERHAETKTGQY